MASPQYSILYSAKIAGTASSGSPGDVLITDATSGLYTQSTTAARGSRRSTGIAAVSFVPGDSIEIYEFGQIDAATMGLGPGTDSWVRVSTTGHLERVASPGVSDEVVGWIEANGMGHVFFGVAPIGGFGSGGGGGFTPPTGTGPMKVLAGAMLAMATAIDLTSANDVMNVLGHANGGTDVSSPGASGNILTSNGTNWTSGAPDTMANVGSGAGNVYKTKSGVQFQLKTLLAGSNVTITDNASDITIAASGGGAFTPPTGTGFVTVTGGTLDAASLAFPLLVNKGGTGATTFGTAGILHGSGTSAVTCSLIVNADVAAGAAIVASKLVPPGSSTQVLYVGAGPVFAADSSFVYDGSGTATLATGLKVGGGSYASSATIRFPDYASIRARNEANTDDCTMAETTSGMTLRIGAGMYGGIVMGGANGVTNTCPSIGMLLGGVYRLLADANNSIVTVGYPLIGETTASSPFGAHAEVVTGDPAGGTLTLSASEYSRQLIQINRAMGVATSGGSGNIDFPTPGAGFGYWKWVYNGCSNSHTLRKAGGGGVTPSGPAPGNVAGFWITSGGVFRMTADRVP